MQIISRATWGARHDRGFRAAPLPALRVWLHHSVTIAPDLVWADVDGDHTDDDEERAMRTLEDIGEQRFGGGISYTFAVMPSGRVYEGHGVDRQGAHTAGQNSTARAIVLVGDYSTRAPTAAQRRSVAALLQHGDRAGWWVNPRLAGGHRDAAGAQTACPGNAAYRAIPEINRLAMGPAIDDDGGDDVQLTDKFDWNKINALGPAAVGHKILSTWQHASTARNQTSALLGMVRAMQGDISESEARILGALTAGARDLDTLADDIVERLETSEVGQLLDALTDRLEAQGEGSSLEQQ